MPMRVIFRADASLAIGTGHVMRCLTLADALRARGADCAFVCREHPGHLLDLIGKRGYPVSVLPLNQSTPAYEIETHAPAHAHWLGGSWRDDAGATLKAIGPDPADWVVVDHYALDSRWQSMLRGKCHRLMAIDDLADRDHACDLLLDQNLGRVEADYKPLTPAGCTILAGPTYAILRPEFAALRGYSLSRRQGAALQCLLISMGGVDKDNYTVQILQALCGCVLPAELKIQVVLGPQAPWIDEVREAAAGMPRETEVLVGVSDMARLMADADLAIGAAGSTSWERCCMGLPALQIVLAPNQEAIARALQEHGAALAVNGTELHQELNAFFSRTDLANKLEELGQNASQITDGLGASRVADAIIGSAA